MHDHVISATGPSRRTMLVALPALAGLSTAYASHEASTPRPAPSVERAVETLGTYQGPGCVGTSKLEGLSKWLGRRPARHLDFLAQDSWVEMIKAAYRGSKCWQSTGMAMSIGVPLLPKERSVDLARGADGAYDKHFVAIADAFVKHDLGNSVIRLGWEFNQTWFAWRADRDPEAWVEFWKRAVMAMRSAHGAQFQFDWCTAWSRGAIPPDRVYPGDEFVDIIGMDIYNVSWHPTTPEQRWKLKRDSSFGLAWHRSFAAEHHKPVSFPEWGTGKRSDGRGGGDDPYFMEKMTAWLATSDLAYHNYWDYRARDIDGSLSDGTKPAAEAAFLRFFGGKR